CTRSPVTGAALEDLLERFFDRTLTHAEWTHAAHLAVGAWHVDRHGLEEALPRLRIAIRALNDSHGTKNSETSGYHETITAAYVRLLAAALARATTPLSSRVETILAGPLADKTFLFRFWSRDQLMSPAARAAWLPPDLAPLELGY
ncbi:MAG: hypothetical protein JWN44_6317, partial [Myxococcales bacterium]|nr:hypothetical protein [Myxococcales bacterium]